MKLGTLNKGGQTSAIRINEDNSATLIKGYADVGALLAQDDWRTIAESGEGTTFPAPGPETGEWASLILSPSKIVCVGLNYRNHILEMGRELPEYPTLFAKYPEALIGAYDDIVVPGYAAQALDWEGELAIVIGSTARRLEVEDAEQAIAGYAVINDVTMRDYQYRTPEWFQGKTLERSAPFGPYLVTRDEYQLGTQLTTKVDGEVVQTISTDDLVFSPAELVSYISKIVTLNPGDVIASGTPGGVGHARKPPRYLTDGSVLSTSIAGLGEQSNRVVVED